jgi:acyl-CoA reductase-like NAD-dependent aldehyde dehydrogenase
LLDARCSVEQPGQREGAHLRLGGSRVGSTGYFVEPTVLTNTDPALRRTWHPAALSTEVGDERQRLERQRLARSREGASALTQEPD